MEFKPNQNFQPQGTNFAQDMNEQIRRVVREYLNSGLFSARKLGDTPTDRNSLIPRKYVTANGAVTARPTSSVATVGQFYLATDTNIPMWYTAGGWRNGAGSVVAAA